MLKRCLLAIILTTGAINADKFEFNTIKRDASGNIKDNGQVIPDEKVIVSTGYGTTKKQALKNAFKSAIEQYIGVFVDSETMIKNGKLIKDNILTASNGFIKKYDEISVDKDNGLIEMKIKAVVKSQKVFKKIKKLKISTISIDNTKDIYARVVTKKKSKEDALKILEKYFEELYSISSFQDILDIKILNAKVEEDNVKNNKILIKIEYEISLNYEIYIQRIKKLEQIFSNMGGTLHKRVKILSLASAKNNRIYFKLENFISKDKYIILGIFKEYGESDKLDIWTFPKSWKNIYRGKYIEAYNSLRIVLEIKDEKENILFAKQYKSILRDMLIGGYLFGMNSYFLGRYGFAESFENIRILMISPIFTISEKDGYYKKFKDSISVYVNIENISKIKNITLELEEI